MPRGWHTLAGTRSASAAAAPSPSGTGRRLGVPSAGHVTAGRTHEPKRLATWSGATAIVHPPSVSSPPCAGASSASAPSRRAGAYAGWNHPPTAPHCLTGAQSGDPANHDSEGVSADSLDSHATHRAACLDAPHPRQERCRLAPLRRRLALSSHIRSPPPQTTQDTHL
jgi:hypothetical protein